MATKYNPAPIGARFGRLTVLSYEGQSWRGQARWRARCDCGGEKTTLACYIVDGLTQSCGCLRRERTAAKQPGKKHGLHKTVEYRAWQAMKMRCYNPNATGFDNYGGRGVQVCAAWRRSFLVFLKAVGKRPSPKHSLGRIDDDGHYEPGNVAWQTAKQQRAAMKRRSGKLPPKRPKHGQWTWRGKVRDL